VLFVVLVVQILELILLQEKYDLFTGGFLQPYSYQSWSDRVEFIGLSFWVDFVFFYVLSLPWFWWSKRRNACIQLTAYNYTFVTLSVMGVWLALKFKVLSYFNDTLNFLLIKNLAGGSLTEALSYVANEAAIFGAGVLLLLFLYWVGYHWINRHAQRILPDTRSQTSRSKRAIWTQTAVGLATIALMWFINSDASLRYGLGKKTSYTVVGLALDEVSDLDRDGYGLFMFPTDPENLNPAIYPGALDVPGNGVDEDGYAGDFNWDGPAEDPLAQLVPIPGKHILLVVLESARADILGKRWQGKLVAPTITRMSRSGTNIEYAYSHHGYTVSSIKAIFSRTLSSKNDRVLLTDFLRRSGYSLSFISGQDESFGGISAFTGMDAPGNYLFDARSALEDRVFPSKDPGSLRLSEERVVRQFKSRADEVNWKTPQFFYINLQAAHFPYSNPQMPALINEKPIKRSDITAENIEPLHATYWNAIAVADQAVANMIALLKQKGVYQDTLIVILGDHGESLFDDHFLGHGHALDEIQTRIPLVINSSGLETKSAVGQLDVAELLVLAATGRADKKSWSEHDAPQFQLVGSLDQPQLIGTVSTGDTRTVLDLRTRKVFFSDLGHWEDFDKAINDPGLKQRTAKLIQLWETARWQSHLSRANK
ncbi:MAG: sulfatase-like hydrolase/transferase, partial [Gammaproteobacteria bacterium]